MPRVVSRSTSVSQVDAAVYSPTVLRPEGQPLRETTCRSRSRGHGVGAIKCAQSNSDVDACLGGGVFGPRPAACYTDAGSPTSPALTCHRRAAAAASYDAAVADWRVLPGWCPDRGDATMAVEVAAVAGGESGRMCRAMPLLTIIATLVASCGSPAPSPTMSLVEPPPPSQAAFSGSIAAANGGTVTVPGGLTLEVPPGGLSTDATARITPQGAPAVAPNPAYPAEAVGPSYEIALGASLLAPAVISVPLASLHLPAGTAPESAFFAWFDTVTARWVPAGGTYDATAGTLSLQVDHLSLWQVFVTAAVFATLGPTAQWTFLAGAIIASAHPERWNWSYWLPVLKKIASLSIPEIVQALSVLTTPCTPSLKGYVVDSSLASNMIQGCVTGTSIAGATVRVYDLTSFYLSVAEPRGGAVPLGPGDGVDMLVTTSSGTPVRITATMTREGLARTVIEILLRLISGNALAGSGSAIERAVGDIYAAEKKAWDGLGIYEALQQRPPDYASATEHLVSLLTGTVSGRLFANAVIAAGRKYDIAVLANLDPGTVNQIVQIIDLGDLIVSTGQWAGDFLAHAQVELDVSGPQLGWTTVGSVPQPLGSGFGALTLAGGSILFENGFSFCGCSNGGDVVGRDLPGETFERYDPAANTWRMTGPTRAVGQDGGWIALSDGRVLLTGWVGSATDNSSRPAAELFDPRTNEWTPMGAPSASSGYALVKQADGSILLLGGSDAQGQPLWLVQAFSPQAGTWRNLGSLSPLQLDGGAVAATQLPDGRVFVWGAWAPEPGPVTVEGEIFDPITATSTAIPSLSVNGYADAAWSLPNGDVALAALDQDTGNRLITAVFDPPSDTWVSRHTLALGSQNPVLLPLADGTLLAIGGIESQSPPNTDVSQCYVNASRTVVAVDPLAGSGTALPSIGIACSGVAVAQLADGRVLVAGGCLSVPRGSSTGLNGSPNMTVEILGPVGQ